MVFNYNILAAEKSTAVSKIEIKLNLMTLCKKKDESSSSQAGTLILYIQIFGLLSRLEFCVHIKKIGKEFHKFYWVGY